jgi:GTP diphosphokinase / guanosine-3',5'-bis(diphosphate) 3'-diphosphatase
LIATLLYPLVRHEIIDAAELRERFGDEPGCLAEQLVRLADKRFKEGRAHQAEGFRKMIMVMAGDVRVLLIKLAESLAFLRWFVQQEDSEDRTMCAREADAIYAPLANRLGVHTLKSELEDLVFQILDPEHFKSIVEGVEGNSAQQEAYVSKMIERIQALLKNRGLKPVAVYGRTKHIFGVWQKMHRRKEVHKIEDLYDVIAFRVLLDNIPECYQALGVIHEEWRPIPGQFDDYIAVPKPNGYSSLHTAVVGLDNQRVEIQIRTEAMHQVAEYGIAAHWAYKERRSAGNEDGFDRLRRVLAGREGNPDDPNAFLRQATTDLFDNEIFIFTPNGDVRELPAGATPVDFAYAIHSQVGDTCVGAKVNNRIQPLGHELQNGDVVEILTKVGRKPNLEWIQFAKTNRARQKIRRQLNEERRAQDREKGMALIERAFKNAGFNLNRLTKDGKLERALSEQKFKNVDTFAIAVGRGKTPIQPVIRALMPKAETMALQEQEAKEAREAAAAAEEEPVKIKRGQSRPMLVIDGIDDMMLRYARCCNPIVGDKVVGFVTRGRGITIHRRDCDRLRASEKERLIDAAWTAPEGSSLPVRVRVAGTDRPGILAKISDVFSSNGVNILSATIDAKDGGFIDTFTVQVESLDQLNKIAREVKGVKGVQKVQRLG